MTIALVWHEEPIKKGHERNAFDCGDSDLNSFLHRFARQSHDLGGVKTFLAIDDTDNTTVLGFYSLAPATLDYARTPEIVRRGLTKQDVPGFRLARLATYRNVQGHGLGGQLLLAAGRRCLRVASEVGGVMLIIDAKSERAAARYASYGAVPLEDSPLTLLLSLATIKTVLEGAGRL